MRRFSRYVEATARRFGRYAADTWAGWLALAVLGLLALWAAAFAVYVIDRHQERQAAAQRRATAEYWRPYNECLRQRSPRRGDNRAAQRYCLDQLGRSDLQPVGPSTSLAPTAGWPEVGKADSGYRYNGGRPSLPSSWDKLPK